MARSAGQPSLEAVDEQCEWRWDRLASRSGSPPFMRPGWIRAWMDAFAPGQEMRVLTVRRGDELSGILPLMPGRWRVRSPTNGETMIFSPVVADLEAAVELADRLLSPPAPIVDLAPVPMGQAMPAEVIQAEAERRGAAVLRRTMSSSPVLDVSGSWTDFTLGLSPKRRQDLRRLDRRIRNAGEVCLELHDGSEDLGALLKEGFRLEARKWKRAAGSAILSDPATTRFYTSAACWAAERGILRLAFLRLDGRAIAFSYGFEDGDRYYAMKLGMDDAYAKLGPGAVLAQRLIEHAFGQPNLVQFDFLGQNDPYKAPYATGTREQVRLQIFPPGRRGALQREVLARTVELRSALADRLSPGTRTRFSAVRNRVVRARHRLAASRRPGE